MDISACFYTYWSKSFREFQRDENGVEEFDLITLNFRNDYELEETSFTLGLIGFYICIHLHW
jgi:hypothetical protein